MSSFREPNSQYVEGEDRSFANRSDGMWMSTIPNKEKRRHVRDPLNVSDITGTKPHLRGSEWNKPAPAYDQYPQVHPKRLHPTSVNRPMTQGKPYNLGNDDIPGSKPCAVAFRSSRRLNPLEPDYQVPACDLPPAPVPKFLRDSMNISDLPGSSPKPLYGKKLRPSTSCGPESVTDIAGTKPGWKANHQRLSRYEATDLRSSVDSLNRCNKIGVEDINRVPTTFVKTRTVDVLDPTYQWDGEIMPDVSPVPNTKPRVLPGHTGTDYSLEARDIHGNLPGWRKDMDFQRKQYRNINYLQDIPGAQHDTVIPHVTPLYQNKWKRSTNPLDPSYKRLEGAKPTVFWSGYHTGQGKPPAGKPATPAAAPRAPSPAVQQAAPVVAAAITAAAPASPPVTVPAAAVSNLQKDIEAVHALP